MTIHITESQVDKLVNMEDAIDAVERVGKSMAAGEASFVPRTRLRMPNGSLQLMPAHLGKEGVFGYKAYTSFRGHARFLVYLFEDATGNLLAVIDADRLGQLRTGAASGAATRVLARKEVASFGLIGSGYQAETQLLGVMSVRDFETVKVYSRNFDHAKSFCDKMQKFFKASLTPVRNVGEAAECDVVATITSSMTPVLQGEMLKPGCHINAAGGNMLVKRELDEDAVSRADVIVIDSREQGEKECGDFLPLLERGKLHWSDVREFGALFDGTAVRTGDRQVTLFKSQGIGPWDVALAKIVYDRALANKIGTRLDL